MSHVTAIGSQRGGVMIPAIFLVAMLSTITWFGQTRVLADSKAMYAELVDDERRQMVAFLTKHVDCERTLAGYNATKMCPSGVRVALHMEGESMPRSADGPHRSHLLAKSWRNDSYQWRATFVCDPMRNSLRVRVALWAAGQRRYATNPATSQPIDFSMRANDIFGGNSDRRLCAAYFGARPSKRLFAMDMNTLQYQALQYDQRGKVNSNLGTACDGRTGIMWDLFDHSVCQDESGLVTMCKGAKESYENFCDVSGQKTNHNCTIGALRSRLMGHSSCHTFCGKRGYETGMLVGCDPGASQFGHGLGFVLPDTNNGQAVCYCGE